MHVRNKILGAVRQRFRLDDVTGLALLERIGLDLDGNVDPRVDDGGIVVPGRFVHPTTEPGGKGVDDGRQTSGGRAAGQGQRPAGRPRSTGRSSAGRPRTSGTASQVFSQLGLTREQVCVLEGVARAYPQLQVRTTPDLLWLFFLITPIQGLDDTALLVTACPRNCITGISSWAWWWPMLTWIGPRHTNFHPTGSICSFEPEDGPFDWRDSLITLLDLQVTWIVRHLFMRCFGRWPGRQVFHNHWERLAEQRPGELCGGCESGLKYKDCCLATDRAVDPVDRLFLFIKWLHRHIKEGGFEHYQYLIDPASWIPDRRPPAALAEFVYGYRKDPPSWNQIISVP